MLQTSSATSAIPFKSILVPLGTLFLGAIVGIALYVGFALPGILPPASGLFMFLLDTDIGQAALAATSGNAGILLAQALRALPFSFTLGIIAGAVLHRLSFPRLFCYSALIFPALTAMSWLYFFQFDPSGSYAASATQRRMGELFWVYLWVYGWYFLALFISFAVSRKLRRKNAI